VRELSKNIFRLNRICLFIFLEKQMGETNRVDDEQVRFLILNEGEDRSDQLYRLKKGLN
jgi:hypothetical protein